MKGDIFRFLARVSALILVWALLFSKELTHSASLPYILVSCAIFFTSLLSQLSMVMEKGALYCRSRRGIITPLSIFI